jgi:hypothetical protein
MHEANVGPRAKRMTRHQTLLTRWKEAPEVFAKDHFIPQWGWDGCASPRRDRPIAHSTQ